MIQKQHHARHLETMAEDMLHSRVKENVLDMNMHLPLRLLENMYRKGKMVGSSAYLPPWPRKAIRRRLRAGSTLHCTLWEHYAATMSPRQVT